MSAPASLPYQVPDVPGLVLEAMSNAHLDEATELMVDAGLRKACDGERCQWHPGYLPEFFGPLPPCGGPLSHIRAELTTALEAPDTWGVCLRFQGRALQYELIRLDLTNRVAEVTRTLRTSRERPAWFWRETERPVFEALAAAGIEQAQAWIPPGFTGRRRAWLEEHFGASYTGQWRSGGARCWGIPVDLARFTGWPERKAVGFDYVEGRVRVWEATEADLPAVRALLEARVPAGQRLTVLRMLDEWWHLDRATLLLGARAGALRYARALRWRRGTEAGLAYLGPLYDEPEQSLVTAALRAWSRQAGYTQISSFVPDRLLAAPQMQAQMARGGVRVARKHNVYREPFTEVVTDV